MQSFVYYTQLHIHIICNLRLGFRRIMLGILKVILSFMSIGQIEEVEEYPFSSRRDTRVVVFRAGPLLVIIVRCVVLSLI